MTKNEILDQLFRAEKCSKKYGKNGEELKQTVFMFLLEMEECRIVLAYHEGKLNSFYETLMYNQYHWPKSKYNNVNRLYDELVDAPEVPDEIIEEVNVSGILDKLTPGEAQLLRLYAEHGTYRAVGMITKISWKSVYNRIQVARKKVKNIINEQER